MKPPGQKVNKCSIGYSIVYTVKAIIYWMKCVDVLGGKLSLFSRKSFVVTQ